MHKIACSTPYPPSSKSGMGFIPVMISFSFNIFSAAEQCRGFSLETMASLPMPGLLWLTHNSSAMIMDVVRPDESSWFHLWQTWDYKDSL